MKERKLITLLIAMAVCLILIEICWSSLWGNARVLMEGIAELSSSNMSTPIITRGGDVENSNSYTNHTKRSSSNRPRFRHENLSFVECPPIKSFHNSEIVNPHDFELLQNEYDRCRRDANGELKSVFVMIMVASNPLNFKRRSVYRKLMQQAIKNRERRIQYVFLIGKTSNETINTKIDREIQTHRDILQEDFGDSSYNLTLKTIMGIKWAGVYCPEASWVMKCHDDVFINFHHLIESLETVDPTRKVLIGYRKLNDTPVRDPESKRFVPKEQFSRATYPPYVNGHSYVISGCLTTWLFKESLAVPYIPLEDVFVGIVAERLGISVLHSHIYFPEKLDNGVTYFYPGIAMHLKRPDNLDQYMKEYKTFLAQYNATHLYP
ncbi:beta-1,3-galactosyltransferase 5-like [Apostichopus japonicus]|uniref:beta-1,3-galactosyltransferase 5-like n=1 Tax=Stichopus japonicus TaxID=307972 RepID=UPI003AB25356